MPKLTRNRYFELAKIANDIVSTLVDKEVEKEEGCIVREIADRLWNLEFPPPGPKAPGPEEPEELRASGRTERIR